MEKAHGSKAPFLAGSDTSNSNVNMEGSMNTCKAVKVVMGNRAVPIKFSTNKRKRPSDLENVATPPFKRKYKKHSNIRKGSILPTQHSPRKRKKDSESNMVVSSAESCAGAVDYGAENREEPLLQ